MASSFDLQTGEFAPLWKDLHENRCNCTLRSTSERAIACATARIATPSKLQSINAALTQCINKSLALVLHGCKMVWHCHTLRAARAHCEIAATAGKPVCALCGLCAPLPYLPAAGLHRSCVQRFSLLSNMHQGAKVGRYVVYVAPLQISRRQLCQRAVSGGHCALAVLALECTSHCCRAHEVSCQLAGRRLSSLRHADEGGTSTFCTSSHYPRTTRGQWSSALRPDLHYNN